MVWQEQVGEFDRTEDAESGASAVSVGVCVILDGKGI